MLNPSVPADKFLGWMIDMKKGDVMILEYAPGTGTTLKMNGTARGTIPGPKFMRLVFARCIGPHASKQLRTAKLGL